MILLTILLALVIVIGLVSLVSAIVAGAGFVIAFGDVAVFCLIAWLIIKLIRRKKKES